MSSKYDPHKTYEKQCFFCKAKLMVSYQNSTEEWVCDSRCLKDYMLWRTEQMYKGKGGVNGEW